MSATDLYELMKYRQEVRRGIVLLSITIIGIIVFDIIGVAFYWSPLIGVIFFSSWFFIGICLFFLWIILVGAGYI